MMRWAFGGLAAIALLGSTARAQSVEAHEVIARAKVLTIVNEGEQPIAQVYISAPESADWASDALAADVIAPAASFAAALPDGGAGCLYDVRVVFADGTVEDRRGFDACKQNLAAFGSSNRVSATRGFSLSRPPAAKTATAPSRRARAGALRSAEPALPAFPWPAPKPVKQVTVPAAQLGGPNATLDQVLTNLERGIARASPGYETGVFGGPPGGFVLLTRMERIQKDGTPFPAANRFTIKGNPRAGFWDMLAGLMGEQPGYFRVIAFAVTDNLAIDPNKPVSSIPAVSDGAARLPPELGRQKLGNKRVYALVYAYERKADAAHRPWINGAPSALQHLRLSGIGRALGF